MNVQVLNSSGAPIENTQGTLLASAARTITITSPIQTNYNAKGIIVFLNVTAASGVGGLFTRVRVYDPVSNSAVYLNAQPAAVTATGMYTYVLYPGASGGAFTQITPAMLPRTWEVFVTPVDASSYTYSVGYSLIL